LNLIFPRKLDRHWLCCTLVRYRSGLSHTWFRSIFNVGSDSLMFR